MELVSNRLAGLVLISGSVLFLVAAFLPYSRIFAENDPASRLAIKLLAAAGTTELM